jgi:hypothetical protein
MYFLKFVAILVRRRSLKTKISRFVLIKNRKRLFIVLCFCKLFNIYIWHIAHFISRYMISDSVLNNATAL